VWAMETSGASAQQDKTDPVQSSRDKELDQLGEDEIADLLASRLTDLDHTN